MKKNAKSATAFIVTSGEYSDYGIDALFSSRKLAKAWIDLHADDEYPHDYQIEEWPIDSEADAQRITVWSCAIFLDSGEITEGPRSKSVVRIPFRANVTQRAVSVPAYQGRKVTRVESGVSEDHCLKIAAEERQSWLRESGGK